MRLQVSLFCVLALGLLWGGCASSGHGYRSSSIARLGAHSVSVETDRGGQRLGDVPSKLEAALQKRYQLSGNTSFDRIRFIIERVNTDPTNAHDLIVSARVVVNGSHGNGDRQIERRIRGGVSEPSRKWEDGFVDELLTVIDYQLRLLQK